MPHHWEAPKSKPGKRELVKWICKECGAISSSITTPDTDSLVDYHEVFYEDHIELTCEEMVAVNIHRR